MERKDRGGKTSMVNKVDREVRKINEIEKTKQTWETETGQARRNR